MSVGNMPAYFFFQLKYVAEPPLVDCCAINCRSMDTSLATDFGDGRAFFALLDDERFLRVRKLRCFHAFPRLSQPRKI